MDKNKSTTGNIMYKTLGFRQLIEILFSALVFKTADSDEARNPLRHIHSTVGGNLNYINATICKFHHLNSELKFLQ